MTATSWEVLKLFISIPISSELVIVACQPARLVWWGAVCIKNQLRVETGLVRGGGHSVQCWLLCSHHVLILSCPGSSVSIQLIIVFVALYPSSDPWVPRPPTAALSPPGPGDQRMTDGDGAWKGLNKALTVCSLLSDVLSKSCCWHLLSIWVTLHFAFFLLGFDIDNIE